jgi:hypothetical protein
MDMLGVLLKSDYFCNIHLFGLLSKKVLIVRCSNPRFALQFKDRDWLVCRPTKRDTFPVSAVAMTKEEERELREQLARLQQEHRDLDAAISALQHSPGSDLLQVQRLKKRKLSLRDRIAHIEDQLTPDIIA